MLSKTRKARFFAAIHSTMTLDELRLASIKRAFAENCAAAGFDDPST